MNLLLLCTYKSLQNNNYIFDISITSKIKQIERFGEPQKNLPDVKKSNHAWLSIEPIKVSSGRSGYTYTWSTLLRAPI